MKYKHSMRDLPKIRDSLSFLYVDYGHLEQSRLGIEFVNLLSLSLQKDCRPLRFMYVDVAATPSPT